MTSYNVTQSFLLVNICIATFIFCVDFSNVKNSREAIDMKGQI